MSPPNLVEASAEAEPLPAALEVRASEAKSLRSQAAHGLKWQMAEIVGRHLLSLAVFTTLARLLDPSAFGLVGLVGLYLTFIGMFVDQGIGTALIQRKELEAEHLNAAFWFNMGCAVFMCAGTSLLAAPIARFFGEASLVPLLRWGSLALVINATSAVHVAQFIRAMDFRRPMLRTLVADAAGGVVGVGMALSGCGVWALIGQQLTTSLAGCCFLWAASDWRPSIGFSLRHLRQLFTVSSSVFATALLWFFCSRIDQVVVGRFAGATLLGEYAVGVKLADLGRISIHQPVGGIAMPALSRLQSDHAQMCHAIYKGMELNALVSFAVFGGLAAVAPCLVPLAFGDQWKLAGSLLQLFSVYTLIVGLLVYCSPALLASGGPGKYLFVSVVCAVGAASACLIGVRFGVHAVVLGLIANIAITGVLSLLFLRQRIGLSPWRYCRPCIVPAIVAVVMFLTVIVSRDFLENRVNAWLSLFLQVAIGACVYLGLIAVLAKEGLMSLWQTAIHAISPPVAAGNRHN